MRSWDKFHWISRKNTKIGLSLSIEVWLLLMVKLENKLCGCSLLSISAAVGSECTFGRTVWREDVLIQKFESHLGQGLRSFGCPVIRKPHFISRSESQSKAWIWRWSYIQPNKACHIIAIFTICPSVSWTKISALDTISDVYQTSPNRGAARNFVREGPATDVVRFQI